MVAAQLARKGLDAVLIDGSGRAGLGVAYSTREPAHVLNVRAEVMSAWPDDLQHFVRLVEEEGGTRHDFVERRQFGRYLKAILEEGMATGRLRLFLKGEARSRRFSDLHPVTGEERYYRDYTELHLGGSYAVNEAVTVNARINNLLDRDFTTYDTQFADLDGDGVYEDGTNEVIYFDHYNNKDKARSVWLSVNVRF